MNSYLICELKRGDKGRVTEVKKYTEELGSMGISPGSHFKVLTKDPESGPVKLLVDKGRSRVLIKKEIAENVLVIKD
ncbi:FeoA family protein [Methanoplanus limicola]|uniref:FeoA family protein n=1 Tax=Methanoplanus limicola DSM 2279 TaxID=937775 RepID=H1YYQ8_9EURY|nr:FeoA family protein [Methanoplanus limicola]EHQ36041.1 FeoA family protein [Methanoplanus limicola DSM 2279]